jgi:1-acyl-sn-glycerol-3-phosphate acyltransferase
MEGTHHLMKKGAIDTGDGTMRYVRVRLGPPISPAREGCEEACVNDLRERAYASVLELHRSIGGRMPAASAPVRVEPPAPAEVQPVERPAA